ncbi:Maltose/galactoside acetyltransferase [Penicillium brevicompactum]|uniref:Maltose/galactoside acetyltransferase n=1 Tax=Penicillium brevicompactum TaxID=5074 RepID=UPI002541198B|nr:Maltose/galactoside acetyltransferase [Penicillium brevicompactum]KAJ5346868.1 Maltose/galactoside acetyltransferase [Penicillium brevicompactum]
MLGTRSDEAGTTASSQSEHSRRLPVSNHPENMSEKALLDENSILGDSRKEALTHSHDVLNVQGCDSEKAARSGGSSVNEYRSSQLDSVDQGDANGPYQEGQHIRGREESATFQLEKMRHRPRSEGRTLLAPSEPASKPVSKINSKKTLAATVEYRSDRIGILQAPTSHVHRPDHDTQLTSQTQRAQQIDDSNPQVTDALEREAQKQEPQTLHGNAPDFVSASFPSHASKQPEAAGQVAQKRKREKEVRRAASCMQQLHSWRLSMRGIHVAKYMPEALQPKNVENFHRCDRHSEMAKVVETRNMEPGIVEGTEWPAQQYSTSGTSTGLGSTSQKRPNDTACTLKHFADPDHWKPPPIHNPSRVGRPGSNHQVIPSIRRLFHETHSDPKLPLFRSLAEQY